MKLRDLFLWLTGLFWLGIGYYAVRCPDPAAHAHGGHAPASVSVASKPILPVKPGLPLITPAELAKHATISDCWIALHGVVYDLTAFVDYHPSKHQEMDVFCGKDGTKPWDVKDSGKEKGKPHGGRALEFLEEYPQVGVYKP